jgi:hypothetical protein
LYRKRWGLGGTGYAGGAIEEEIVNDLVWTLGCCLLGGNLLGWPVGEERRGRGGGMEKGEKLSGEEKDGKVTGAQIGEEGEGGVRGTGGQGRKRVEGLRFRVHSGSLRV